jgi:hypothetical protein
MKNIYNDQAYAEVKGMLEKRLEELRQYYAVTEEKPESLKTEPSQ